MSANKSERGLALMREREAVRTRFFTVAYLKEMGARFFIVCRDCHRWRELDAAALPGDMDVRAAERRFRCGECTSQYVVVGISRGAGDPGPPGIPGSEGFKR